MHAPAEDVVESALLAGQSGLFLFLCHHRVNDNAEGDEERVLSEQQDNEKAADVSVRELVDGQVEDDDRLEAEQALDLAPTLSHVWSRVEVQATNHEERHHAALQNDPTLFDSVSDRVVIGIFIEIFWINVIRMKIFLRWGRVGRRRRFCNVCH